MNSESTNRLGKASNPMGIGSIGSIGSLSFWQQDQNNLSQAQSQDQATALSDALITGMGGLMTTQAKGLASIANKTALDRVNAQLTAALQSAVAASQASSSGPSTSSSGSPATGTGTVPLSTSTSLLTLGIPPQAAITVSDGTNTTTYASTGTDTVGDLINAINNPNIAANAQATATLNGSGELVLTGKNITDSISIGGLFASNLGFAAANETFQPTAPTAPTSSTSSSSGTSSSSATSSSSGTNGSTGASTSTPASSSPGTLFNSAYALQTGGTAETLLASSGLSGTLLNLLA